jgi:two-component system, sensor histidine kinase and response regulator
MGTGSSSGPRLRDSAESQLARTQRGKTAPRCADDLLHELQAHQTELEMQNEALRQAQVALELSRDRYMDLYEFAPVGYFTVDRMGLIAEANLVGAAQLGVERSRLTKRRFAAFVAPEDGDRWHRQFARVVQHRDKVSCEIVLRRDDGSRFHAQVDCLSVATQGESPVVRIAVTDITDRKQAQLAQVAAEAARAVALAEAERLARLKNEFLANMSHEIRTPLDAIMGLAHLMRYGDVTTKQAEYLDTIDAAGRHLLGIINNILDLAKIEADKVVLEAKDFALADLLQGITGLVGDSIRAKALSFHVDVAGVPQALNGDPTRLRQALMNYLSNAVKFTECGGITLRGRLIEETDAGCLLRFEIMDTGIGIAPAQRERLFEAFQQNDSSTTRKYGGTGLGLAITRRIAHLLGGEVGVESTPGQGSTFWLTVRLVRGAAGGAETVREAQLKAEEVLLRDFHGIRVLLVEDDPINQDVTLMLLRKVGLSPDLAEDGREAVRMAADHDYGLILMDVQMPHMDGLEATRAIRAMPGRSATPILANTANAFEEHRTKCLAAGMNDFVAKPIFPPVLYHTLLKWLKQARCSSRPERRPSRSQGEGARAAFE